MSVHYILDGHEPRPCDDLLVWADYMEHADRHVAWTEFADGTFISTVFLGLDHGFGGPPLFFETMIGRHPREPDPAVRVSYEDHQWRYASWDEAEAGHRAAVTLVAVRNRSGACTT